MNRFFRFSLFFIAMMSFANSLFAYTEEIRIKSGWNLKGISQDVSNLDDFFTDSVNAIYIYRNGKFLTTKAEIGSIKAYEGFWIHAKESDTLEIKISNSSSNKAGNPPIPAPPSPSSRSSSQSDANSRSIDLGNIVDTVSDLVDIGDIDADKICRDVDVFDVLDCKDDNGLHTSDIKIDLFGGWNLRGTSISFKINDVFDDVCVGGTDSIRLYRGGKFKAYDKDSSMTIKRDEGFWIYANKDCTVAHEDSADNPPEF